MGFGTCWWEDRAEDPRGRSRCGSRRLRGEGERSATIADYGSIRLEAQQVHAELERVLAANEREAVGELISVVEALLREIRRLTDAGVACDAGLGNARIRRPIEPRSLDVVLLDKVNVLLVCDSGIRELRIADLEFVDQIRIENVRFRQTGQTSQQIDRAIESGNDTGTANDVVLADLSETHIFN